MESAPTPRRILVVDDDPLILVLLEEILSTQGYVVVPCADGEEGWEAFVQSPDVRLAIIDWVMPRLSGLDLIRRIRAHEDEQNRPRTYVILLTSRSGRARVTEGLQSGADDYLVKDDRFQTKVQVRLQAAAKQIDFEQMVANVRIEWTED